MNQRPARKSSAGDPALQRTAKELADIRYALDASAIVAFTDVEGRITSVNEQFCRKSKYCREELIGEDHRLLNSGFHPPSFMRDLWQTILDGRVWRDEIRNRAKDGTFYWVDTTIVPFLDGNGRPYQFAAIRYDITARKELEETLRQLPDRIIQAQESEREWISREIHDDLGQALATLKIMLQSQRGAGGDQKGRDLAESISYLDGIIGKTRKLATGLHPSTLEILGLPQSINALVEEFRATVEIEVQLQTDDINGLHLRGQPINLYRIIQEALTNVRRHAGAEKVVIEIRRHQRCLLVTVRDDGRGFVGLAGDSTGRLSGGLGLTTMSERARLLGGELYIETSAQTGTTLTVTVPLKPEEEGRGRA